MRRQDSDRLVGAIVLVSLACAWTGYFLIISPNDTCWIWALPFGALLLALWNLCEVRHD